MELGYKKQWMVESSGWIEANPSVKLLEDHRSQYDTHYYILLNKFHTKKDVHILIKTKIHYFFLFPPSSLSNLPIF